MPLCALFDSVILFCTCSRVYHFIVRCFHSVQWRIHENIAAIYYYNTALIGIEIHLNICSFAQIHECVYGRHIHRVSEQEQGEQGRPNGESIMNGNRSAHVDTSDSDECTHRRCVSGHPVISRRIVHTANAVVGKSWCTSTYIVWSLVLHILCVRCSADAGAVCVMYSANYEKWGKRFAQHTHTLLPTWTNIESIFTWDEKHPFPSSIKHVILQCFFHSSLFLSLSYHFVSTPHSRPTIIDARTAHWILRCSKIRRTLYYSRLYTIDVEMIERIIILCLHTNHPDVCLLLLSWRKYIARH